MKVMNRVNLKQVWPHQKTSPTNNDALKKEIVNTLGKRMKELRRQSLDNNRRLSNSRDIGHQILSDIICNHRGQSIDNMDIAANPNQMDEQEYINHHQKISSSSSELHDKFSSDTTTFDHNISSALPLSQGSEVSFTNSNSNSNRNCARLSDSFVGSATSGTPYEKLMASYHNASSHETFDESELIEVLGLDTYQEMMCRIEEEIAAEMTQYGEYDINTPIEGIGRNISHVTKSGSQLSLGAINTRNRMDTAMRIDDNDDNDSTYIKVGYQPPLTPTSFNHIESPSDSPSSTCVEGFEEFEEDSIICPNCRIRSLSVQSIAGIFSCDCGLIWPLCSSTTGIVLDAPTLRDILGAAFDRHLTVCSHRGSGTSECELIFDPLIETHVDSVSCTSGGCSVESSHCGFADFICW